MSVATVEIPVLLFNRIKQLSEQQQITVGQFVAAPVAEKMCAVEKEGYIAQRAARADEQKYAEALSRIPDVEPEEHDKL